MPLPVDAPSPLQSRDDLRILSRMDVGSLSPQQLKELVCGIVDDRLRELLGDPDLGLQLGETLRTRLKASLVNTERLSGEEVARRLGLRW